MGYYMAGFEVVGVDIEPQPHYPFEFHQADAFAFLEQHQSTFNAIHASPPCQEYSRTTGIRNFTATKYGKLPNVREMLIPQTLDALRATGKPWVLENVPGSPLDAIVLCGSMFGRPIIRHRLFASPILLMAPGQCHHGPASIDFSGGKVRGNGALATNKQYTTATGYKKYREKYLRKYQGAEAIGIAWMTLQEMSQAIPPDYTEHIGKQLMRAIQ